MTLRQLKRFRSIRRGYVSFLILLALIGVATLDNLLVGNRALIVSHQGTWHFPFLMEKVLPGTEFGLSYDGETDYRELKLQFEKEAKGDWVLMPLVPYAAKLDAPDIIETLVEKNGELYRPESDKPFDGRAYSVFKDKPAQKRQEWALRKGLRQGDMRGWNMEGEQVEKARYDHGQQVKYEDLSDGKAAALAGAEAPGLLTAVYPPTPPVWRHHHFLGTNTAGIDVLAMLFGGWQRSIYVVSFYLVITLSIGIVIGGTLGYFGGWYDLLGQRVIEVWSTLPFLFLVMIVSSVVDPQISILVVILCLFSWIQPTIYMRTATYREKSRDYVAASRLLGTGSLRILLRHILPNTISVLVTLVPFMVSGIITGLAALDFLGFGLPPDEPSWGRLLQEGTENFNYPWIVSSAFMAMVFVLVLVTFVGEAVREAFDPKKFTTYE